jgi:hypothetical protein
MKLSSISRVLKIMLRRFFPFAAAVMFTACQAQQPARAPVAPELMQWSGQYGGNRTAGHRVLRDASAWNAFWKDVGQQPPRAFDPGREMAIAIFMGERRSGGFSTEILGAAPEGGKFVVTFRETSPAPGGMVTQALTAPWAVATVPRSDLPLEVRPVPTAAARATPAQK